MTLKVELLAYTPEGEILSAMAAKLTHSKSSINDLRGSDEEELKNIPVLATLVAGEFKFLSPDFL